MTEAEAAAAAQEQVAAPAPEEKTDAPAEAAAPAEGADAAAPVEENAGEKKGQRRPRDDEPMPKSRDELKPVPQPNESGHQAAIKEIEDRIAAHNKRLEAIKETLDRESESRKGGSAEWKVAKQKVDELRAKTRQIFDERKALFNKRDAVENKIKTIVNQIRDRKAQLKYESVEQIETRIAQLEDQIAHESLSIHQEKKYIAEISELNKSKGVVGSFDEMRNQVDELRAEQKALREKIGVKNSELKVQREAEDAQNKVLDHLKQQQGGSKVDFKALIQERKAIYEKIREERNNIRQENQRWSKESYQWRLYRRQLSAIRRIEIEQEREERRKKREEQRREELEAQGLLEDDSEKHPWEAQMNTCDYLVSYLQRLDIASQSPASEDSQDGKELNYKPLEGKGHFHLKRDADDDDSSWMFKGTKKGGKKGGKKRGGKDEKSRKLVLDGDVFASFEFVEIAPPSTFGQLTDTIQAVQKKRSEFEKRPAPADKKKAKKDEVSVSVDAKEDGVKVNVEVTESA